MVFVHCPVGAEDGLDHHENEYVICNCCTCGCVPYIINRELGQKVYPLIRGAYVAVTDLDRCAGHGECGSACPFDVRLVQSDTSRLVDDCYGCGVCVAACPEQAISMRPRAGAAPEALLAITPDRQTQGKQV
jgi:ferredoxin